MDDIASVFADLWEHLGPSPPRGHDLVDLRYREPSGVVPPVGDVEVVTGAAIAADLAAVVRARRPRLVTCSRWPTYPFGVSRHGPDRIATIVSWTPEHEHVGVGGRTPRDLARACEEATGSQCDSAGTGCCSGRLHLRLNCGADRATAPPRPGKRTACGGRNPP